MADVVPVMKLLVVAERSGCSSVRAYEPYWLELNSPQY